MFSAFSITGEPPIADCACRAVSVIQPGRPCGETIFEVATEYSNTASSASAIGETTQSVLDPVSLAKESDNVISNAQ
jgi:hypothetical protein